MLDHLGSSWVILASQKCIPYSTLAHRGCKSAIRYAKVACPGCKSAIRYANVLRRCCKSAIRYAISEIRLPPLWAHMDVEVLKCYKVCKKKYDFATTMGSYGFEGVQNGLCNPWVEVCRSAIRYCKLLFRGAKSAIRYALFENRWPPLWAPSDLGSQKRNTYAFFLLTLHSLWAPSDLGSPRPPQITFGSPRPK